ncbi:FapA family protein [Lysinibacillus louembei]|uniref:FapA family protein n=1 Tax=Lysinibacillus louembei TaxID=1470088 RepID=A0ABZ0S0Y3_9BACI|nr:FapA family protein [Lysinibacillus louembei]WPK10937.1 FapA family protein [Lysinibacillus louembei]
MSIFTNDYFEMTEQNGKVFIRTIKSGFPLKDFDTILRSHPRVKLTNFAVLKNVLATESETTTEIGIWLPNIEIEVARDNMSASLFIYETVEELQQNSERFIAEIESLLQQKKIVHGIQPIQIEKIVPTKAYLIAQGTPPIKGEDAKITYLEIPERKPVIQEDGKADYYEMNFIFEIHEDSWLGEKILAQPGVDGQTIFGETIVAAHGKDIPLKYDRKAAYEVEEDGKIVLRSKYAGALGQVQGQLTISHHLSINNDIGIETGNIDFQGSLTVRGTVQSGFSIIAKGDISIESNEGITGAKLIRSLEGDIYIRGGVFGLGETEIEAGGNIYIKHVNEANLKANGEIHIGSYSLGSHLSANSIFLDERKGKIIGGTATAKDMIVSAIAGNHLERRTELIINTFNKKELQAIIQEKAKLLKNEQDEIVKYEAQLEKILSSQGTLNSQQAAVVEQVKQKINALKKYVASLDNEIKVSINDLHNAGKEEIKITKEAYPGTYIQIGKKSSLLTKMTNGTFLLDSGELNV